MHKRKPYRCPTCGADVPDLPMPVLRHQLSHARPRPYVRDRPAREPEEGDGATEDRRRDRDGWRS